MVRVPVLSVQIWVAPPIVSQELSYLTKLLRFRICALETLRDIVTARGNPSGIATTIIVIEIIIPLIISVQNLLSALKLKFSFWQFSISLQWNKF